VGQINSSLFALATFPG